MRNWLIYRGANCLGAYRGTKQEAADYAYAEWGIGCTVILCEG